ncbi:MAG: nucleotidyltransferase family protein [Synechococcus sp.]
MKKKQVIAILRKHEAHIRQIGATGLYLFGSTARDEAGPDSDIDLFFDYAPDRPFSLYNLVDIKEFVSSLFNTPVDIMPRDSIHHLVRDRAIATAERVF